MSDTRPPGSGLQPERTDLAWRRTALAVAATSLVGLRVLPAHAPGWPSLVPGLLGLLTAIVLLVAGERRYRTTRRRLTAATPAPINGGLTLLVTAVSCALLAAGGLTALLG